MPTRKWHKRRMNPAASFRLLWDFLSISYAQKMMQYPNWRNGRRWTGLDGTYWGWIHSGDQSLQRRMYLKLGRYFLSHADHSPPMGNVALRNFLCQGKPRWPSPNPVPVKE